MQKMNFSGYKINELFPRKTRRATAVNWILAWLASQGEELQNKGPLPVLSPPPNDPLTGHEGDPLIS